MYSSKLPILQKIFPEGALSDNELLKRPTTAATQFKKQVNELAASLLIKAPHYVRCIKSNDVKRGGYFMDELCLHQIRYLGLLENVRVRRAGYAFRQLYTRFLDRYRMLCPATWPLWESPDQKKQRLDAIKAGKTGVQASIESTARALASADQSFQRQGVEKILAHVGIPKTEYLLGNTKLFIKQPTTLFQLEDMRENRVLGLTVKIQAQIRGCLAKLRYKKMRKAAIGLQRGIKKFLFKVRIAKLRACFVTWLAYNYQGKLKSTDWMTERERAFVNKSLFKRVAVSRLTRYYRQYLRRRCFKVYRDNLVWMERKNTLVKGKQFKILNWPVIKVGWCQKVLDQLRVIFEAWVRRKYRSYVTPEQKAILLEKQKASTLFYGEKINYPRTVAIPFSDNRLGDLINPKTEKKFEALKNEVFTPDELLCFAASISKLNRADYKGVPHALLLTNRNLYISDLSFKIKSAIPIEALSAVSLSPNGDQVVVLHVSLKELPEKSDKKGDFIIVSDDFVELVTKICMRYEAKTSFSFKINFSQEIVVHVKGGEQSIKFTTAPEVEEPTYVKDKKTLAVCLPKKLMHDGTKPSNLVRASSVMEGMNERDFHKFMEGGTLPRNFDFKGKN